MKDSEITDDKPNILILCSGNAARSQMAEAFLKRAAGDRFNVFSAGLEPTAIHPFTRQVMAEKGYDLAGQYAKSVREFLGRKEFRYLIVVCERAEANCPSIFPGVLRRYYWPFEDPAAFQGSKAEQLAKFREVRDQIEARLMEWLKEIGP